MGKSAEFPVGALKARSRLPEGPPAQERSHWRQIDGVVAVGYDEPWVPVWHSAVGTLVDEATLVGYDEPWVPVWHGGMVRGRHDEQDSEAPRDRGPAGAGTRGRQDGGMSMLTATQIQALLE